MNIPTISFVISHTGRNKAMIDAAKILKKNRMKVVAVTGSNNSLLAKLCDESITTYVYR